MLQHTFSISHSFLYKNRIGQQLGVVYFLNKPGHQKLCDLLADALRFPTLKRRRRCFTGLEPGLIFKVCSVTSLRMPGMSEGFHAKMSLLPRRKSTSALSYLEESVVPMRTTLPLELLGSMRTSLVPSIGSKDPADRLGLGASSATSFLRPTSSTEATIPTA